MLNTFGAVTLGSVPQEMREICKILLDCPLKISSSSQMELEEALDTIDPVLPVLVTTNKRNPTFHNTVSVFDDLKENVRFLKNFILFVGNRGLDLGRMADLLILVQGSIFYVVSYIFKQFLSFNSPDDDYEQLTERFEPVRYNVCEIYVGVLQEASRLSLSSTHPIQGSHLLLLADFVDSLLFLLSKLLFQGSCSKYIFGQQMGKVHEGLRFLRTYLKEDHDKVDKLFEKIHEHIEPMVCEAGILIFSLFQDKLEDKAGLVETLELHFVEFNKKFELIKATGQGKMRIPPMLASYCPQTNLLRFIHGILEKLKLADQCEIDSSLASRVDKLQSFHEDLNFIRCFLVDVVEQCNRDQKFQAFWSCIATVAYETEFILDSMVVGGAPQSFVVPLSNIMEWIKLIKATDSEITHSIGLVAEVQNTTKADLSRIPKFNDLVVGLDDEAQLIIDRLIRGTKSLDIISIVGMPGLGKTTLAKKVYHHPSIFHHFSARSWCTISQVYYNRNSLFEIFECLENDPAIMDSEKNVDDLAECR